MRWVVMLLCAMVSCGRNEPPAVAILSQGFEGDMTAWRLGGKGYEVAVTDGAGREGTKGLRLASREPGAYGVAMFSLPVGDTIGKRLTLSGWIRSEAITRGFAGLWLRIDGAPGEQLMLDNMQSHGVKGTTPWTRHEVTVDVPEGAKKIVVGALLTGDGTAWVDDLSLTPSEPPPPRAPIAIGGVARAMDGAPVAGAVVAIIPPAAARAIATTRSGVDGRFAFTVPAGPYALTATAPGRTAAYRAVTPFEAAASDADVTFGGASFTVRGTVRIGGAPAAGAMVAAARVSEVEGDTFYVPTDEAGAFALTLPPAQGYSLTLEDRTLLVKPASISESKDQTVEIKATRRGSAPDEVVAWIKATAIPIATADPTHDLDDLAPLGKIVGAARVVALGEATHGTREFFQLKHRVLEYLVAKQGVTVFTIEANYPESLAVNEYVLHGTGDARKALAGMYFWTWNTEEVLEQIEWMRRWNADATHAKVKFLGFDMQTAHVAAARVLEYLAKVDAEAAKSLAPVLEPLDEAHERGYANVSADRRASIAKALADLIARFDTQKATWSAGSSAEAWAVARQHAVVLAQAEHKYTLGPAGSAWRDESMARNIRWILDQELPGARIAVWAHNFHVSLTATPAIPMGSLLAHDLGPDYVVLGFVFDRGAFQAMEPPKGLGSHVLGEVPAGNVAAAFHRAGMPMLALDLRHPPAGAVADWLAAPHPMRETGSVFSDEGAMTQAAVLPERFHAVIYVDETTRARPVN